MSDAAAFHALASASRRELLDRLFEEDGQTLAALSARLAMTRFGVMKHLAILEEANLVVTQRAGREKRHYLNVLPIVEMYDRWVSKYAARWSRTLLGPRAVVEESAMDETGRRHVFVIYVRANRERVWEAITSGALTRQYFHDTTVESTWEPGAPVRYLNRDGSVAVEGQVIRNERPRTLAYSWHVLYHPQMALEAPSRVTWDLEQLGEICKVTLAHDAFPAGSLVYDNVAPDGWAHVLSGLKTLIETGEPLAIPA